MYQEMSTDGWRNINEESSLIISVRAAESNEDSI